MKKTTHRSAFTEVPLDRLSRDMSFWVRAAKRLRAAGLLSKNDALKLFVANSSPNREVIPFGFRKTRKGLIPHPDEQQVIRRLARSAA
jgi:hypothetical protein